MLQVNKGETKLVLVKCNDVRMAQPNEIPNPCTNPNSPALPAMPLEGQISCVWKT